jgi:outer membrane protein assembly factor BamA
MSKLLLYALIVLPLLGCGSASFAQYRLRIVCEDRDSLFDQKNLGLTGSFNGMNACAEYINRLPSLLQAKGFAAASVDSVAYDSSQALVHLYIGDLFRWAQIQVHHSDAGILAGAGWSDRNFSGRPFEVSLLHQAEENILNYLENNGYPFARIALDSIFVQEDRLSASLRIERGPLYRIDSLRIYGQAKISVDFIQRYLNLPNGSIYSKEKLQSISRRLMELPFVQEQAPWTLTLLGTGSVLNLYLRPRKSSQIDVLVGFLPDNAQLTSSRLLITGQATISLKNALGSGETIGLNWQQIQVQSPQLDLNFQLPYLFHTPFGLNTTFDLFKKDSSYININFLLGIQFAATATRSGSVFFQTTTSNQLNVDTPEIIASHQLPNQADLSSLSLGLTYAINNTNYRFNPVRGNELEFTGSAGTKKIRRNAEIQKLKDPADSGFDFNSLYDSLPLNSYQFRLQLAAAHYFPIGRNTTLKLGLNSGVFQSPTQFRNEVFQVGGYKLLRGFDEQSILASQYAVGTVEYRILIAQNSFLFSFLDMGWAKNAVPGYSANDTYLGFGFGLAFETKAGIFNMSYALGKRDNSSIDLRQSKIHLGYVNFF